MWNSRLFRSVNWVRPRYVRANRWPRSPVRRKPNESISAFVVKSPVRAVRWAVRFLTADIEVRRFRRINALPSLASPHPNAAIPPESARGVERCDVRYINLDHRSDRREDFENEMHALGVSWHNRHSATLAHPGALGCSLSHLQVLKHWEATPGRLLLVCEDDARFVASRSELDALIEEFTASPHLQVLALAYRTAWHIPISDRLAASADIQTTAAYVAKPEIVPDLVAAFEDSVRGLRDGASARTAALDKVWKRVQKKRLFAIPRKKCVIQRAGFSDIQEALTDYYGD